VAFTPDGQAIISGSEDKTLKLWETHTGRLINSFEGHTNPVRALAISPDGQIVISGSDKPYGYHADSLMLWDAHASTGNPIRSLDGHPGYGGDILAVDFSPDGQAIISASLDNTLRLWDRDLEPLPHSFVGHTEGVTAAAFSPDGRMIISGSYDKTLKLWDIRNRRLIRSFDGHTDRINSVAFSPDGQTFISGSSDKTIRQWEITTGASTTLFDNTSEIHGLVTNGHWLVCSDSEGHVWIFDWVKE
jgi:WD40 repeat protein